MEMMAGDRLAGMSCADSLSPLNTPRVAKTWPSAASTMSALGVGSITKPPLSGKVAMQKAMYPAGTMMIAASAAAITYARRSWSARAKRHRARRGLGVSFRECEPNRNAVRIRVSLARGRRIYPSAAARNVEPENFRAGGWRRTVRATRCGTRAEAVGLAATDTVAPPAPRRAPMVTVTPSDDLGGPICVQNSHRGRRDER